MGRRRLTVADLDERVVAAFVDARQPRWRAQRAGATVRRLLMYFRAQGVIGPLPAIVDDSLLTQLAGRSALLVRGARLGGDDRADLPWILKQFLCERLDPAATSVTSLRAGDVAAFVRRHARAASPGRAKMMVTALRAMFRFFFQHGELDVDFSVVVPTVPDWRLASIPRSISPHEIERLIAACDAETAAGRRNRAIVLLLARLGLRAGEVVALELDDLHWRTGEITIRGKKGLRHDRFPLPVEVGTALAAYLRRDRAPGVTRRVFLGMRAPLRGFAGPGAVTTIVRRALSRADLHPPVRGAHLLRHSLATHMLRHGASFSEIGQVLRHRGASGTRDLRESRRGCAPFGGAALAGDGRCAMTALASAVDEYLAIRHGLGIRCRVPAGLLRRFVTFVDRTGSDVITRDLAVQWAMQSRAAQPATWAWRLGIVRRFALWRQATDPRTEVPRLASFHIGSAAHGRTSTPMRRFRRY